MILYFIHHHHKTERQSIMQHTRLNQMQFLRTLAFLNIYILHAGHWNFFNYPQWFGAISAVSFFFMLSGFLTGYFFRPSSIRPGLSAYGQYMRRKIAKFYPIYLLVTLYAVAFSAIPQTFATGYFDQLIAPVLQLIKHILCIQSWFPEGFFSYYGPAWFSSSLLFLTALNIPFFFLLKAIGENKHKNALLLGLIAVFFSGTFIYSYLTRDGFLQFLHYIFPPSRAGIYFGSMAMGMLVRPYADKLRSEEHTALFTLLEAGSLVFWFVSLSHSGPEWMEWNAAWILPNALVLLAFCVGSGHLSRLFSRKPLVYIGGLTMECYLVHSLIIPSYSRYNKFDTTYTLGCIFSLAACLAMTYMVAYVLRKFSEKQA